MKKTFCDICKQEYDDSPAICAPSNQDAIKILTDRCLTDICHNCRAASLHVDVEEVLIKEILYWNAAIPNKGVEF